MCAGILTKKKKLLGDFQNAFRKVFIFCLAKTLLLFVSSLWACHIMPYQLFGEGLLLMSMNLEETLASS